MTQFDGILFDLDGTICEYNRTGADILPVAFEAVGVEPFFTAEEYIAQYPSFVDEGEDIETIREEVFRHFASNRGYDPAVGTQIADVYTRERDQSNVSFLPGASEVVRTIPERFPTGIVTNGSPEMQSVKLQALDIDDLFDPIVFAGYDTPAKPDPKPFETALQTLGTRPEKTLYVGDSVGSDVRGARRAGLPVAWISDGTKNPDPEPDYVLDTPGDVLEIV